MISLATLEEYPIPDRTIGYIYFLLYNNQVVYIGKTSSIGPRIDAHQIDKLFNKCLFFKHPLDGLGLEERRLIAQYNPIYNSLGCTPDAEPFKIIDGILFGKRNTMAIPINGVKLDIKKGLDEGYCNGKIVCIMYGAYHMVRYNLETKEIVRRTMKYTLSRRFDYDLFDFVDKENAEPMRVRIVTDECCEEYVDGVLQNP